MCFACKWPFKMEMNSGMQRLVTGLALFTFSVAAADVVRNPVNVGISLEEFQLFEPTNTLNQDAEYSLPLLMVRPTGWIFGSAAVNDRVDLVFGLGATLFSIPADSGQHATGYQNEVYPAVAMVQASGSYTWGNLKNPALKLAFGQMPYKYNPDSREFGEYLLRSTPYPNSVLNSPFDLVNASQANILGMVLSKNFMEGKWKNDIMFTSTNNFFPLGDISLAYMTRYRINPVFELSAGVNFYRMIPIQPKLSTYKTGMNAYFTYDVDGNKYSTNSSVYKKDSLMTALDSLIVIKADSVAAFIDNGSAASALPTGVSDVKYYSMKGQMLMARFSVDLKPVLGENVDLKFYGEWAMLGVQNQPVFYEKPADRMPVMLGLNIPTGGFLDFLNVEAEYWKNPYLNSNYMAAYNGLATPNLLTTAYGNVGLKSINEDVKVDDIKWSISATKSFRKSFSITTKFARDHMQVMQFHSNSFDKSYGDVMSGKKSWYYVLRAQVAI